MPVRLEDLLPCCRRKPASLARRAPRRCGNSSTGRRSVPCFKQELLARQPAVAAGRCRKYRQMGVARRHSRALKRAPSAERSFTRRSAGGRQSSASTPENQRCTSWKRHRFSSSARTDSDPWTRTPASSVSSLEALPSTHVHEWWMSVNHLILRAPPFSSFLNLPALSGPCPRGCGKNVVDNEIQACPFIHPTGIYMLSTY